MPVDGLAPAPSAPVARDAAPDAPERMFVVFYQPVTHLNRYLVDQYVLRSSIG